MNRHEFELLRELPNKTIEAKIEFKASAKAAPNLIFEKVCLKNSLGWEILLNGTYKPYIPSVTFNFVLKGEGPICRVDVNGTTHGEAGRTHKHDMQHERDPRRNLPHAVVRPDLVGKTVRAIWEDLCTQARIQHIGQFVDP